MFNGVLKKHFALLLKNSNLRLYDSDKKKGFTVDTRIAMASSRFLTLIGLIILSACSTSYQNNGWSGGYSETRLDDNVFKVSFRGNAYTGKERTEDFILLRSAELTLENGYAYFSVMNEDFNVKKNIQTNPSTGDINILSKPRASKTIVLFNEKPKSKFSLNAKYIVKEVQKKYKINND